MGGIICRKQTASSASITLQLVLPPEMDRKRYKKFELQIRSGAGAAWTTVSSAFVITEGLTAGALKASSAYSFRARGYCAADGTWSEWGPASEGMITPTPRNDQQSALCVVA